MAFEFLLPDIGEGLTEAEVVRWLVAVGDGVEVDQPLVEVETDKAVVDIPSPRAGVVLHHGAADGQVIEVGAVLVVIGEAGETWGEAAAAPATAAEAGEVAPIVGTLSEATEELPARSGAAPATEGRVQALPLVRKLAREHGIDLAAVTGSGPGGRVTRDDVMAVVEAAGAPIPTVSGPAPTGPALAGRVVRMSKLRRTIAEHMERSWREIPHVTTFEDVPADRLLDARAALAARFDEPLPLEALVIRAVLPVLAEFPEFNATLRGEEIEYHDRYDIAVAVDTADGLIVPVLAGADASPLRGLAQRIVELGEAARARRLTPEQLAGGTFTVSNIGAVGGGHGTPIIPYGTTAILSVGRAREQAIVQAGELAVGRVMPLSLSYDHRVIDGAMGRRFTARLVENLVEPVLFLAG